MRLLDGTELEFVARVPTVETAVVIKAYAYASRKLDRDVEDIHRLLEIIDTQPKLSADGGSTNRTCGAPGATRPSGCTNLVGTRGG